MRLNCLSNKGSAAPLVYLLLHVFILTGLIFTCPAILDLSNYEYILLFWIDVVITVILFFVVHRADPGYVPYDGVFFTDQEEPPLSASGHNIKYDSMMKLKAADSRIMFPGFDISPSAVDNEMKKKMLMTQKSPNDKSQFLKMTLGSTAVSKNMKDTLSSPGIENMRRDDCDTQRQNDNQEGDMDQTRVDVSLSQEDITQRNDEMEYQLSAPREGEMGQPYPIQSGFNDMSQIEDSPKGKREIVHFNEENRYRDETKKPGHMDQYRVKYGLQLDDVEEEDHTYQTNNSPTKSKGKRDSKLSRQQTNQDEFPRHQPTQNQVVDKNENKENVLEQLSQEAMHDASLTRDRFGKDSLNNIEMVHQPYLARIAGRAPEVSTYAKNAAAHIESEGSKDAPNHESGAEGYANQISKEAAESKKTEQKPLESLYVERRYCTACNLDQPLRSKHCRDCNRCTAQYDHHCPWLGTCIGEKNHLLFFFFLIFQLIEIAWGEAKLVEGVIEKSNNEGNWSSVDVWRIVILIPTTFFFVMVGCLSVFHVYLATRNLTTWEFLSWSKISYLKEWQPSWGSPFSKGIKENLRFFLSKRNELTRWKMPKYKAPLNQQNDLMAN